MKTGSGKDKYPRLGKIVKGVLALPHGNADVERGLSDNKKMLGKDRVKLSSKSIIGNRLSKKAVKIPWKIHDPEHMQPECVPLTKELIGYVRGSHRVYKERLEEEKQKGKRRRRIDSKRKKSLKNKNKMQQKKKSL